MANFNEWKKENPGKSINEFYAGNHSNSDSTPISKEVYVNPSNQTYSNQYIGHTQSSAIERYDLGNFTFSILILIAMLLPWLDTSFFLMEGLAQVNGLELYKVLKFIWAFNTVEIPPILMKSFYLIPIGAILSLFGEVVKKDFLISFGQMSNVVATGFWSYLFYTWYSNVNSQFYELISYGYYLALIGSLFYIYKLFFE
jgi:hypothetical protein